MIFHFNNYAITILVAIIGLVWEDARIAGEVPRSHANQALAIYPESATGPTARPLRTSISWDNRDYDIDTGVPILMAAIRNPDDEFKNRGWALMQLAMLTTQLKGHECLDELIALFETMTNAEKNTILLCLSGSHDRRALPLFVRTLDVERVVRLRLSAAAGLAQWNLRRGVAELVAIANSREMLSQPTRIQYVGDYAIELFETKNRLKGWGFPQETIRRSLGGQVRDRQKFVTAYVEEIGKWWSENEHRFPDWKPGDPLPEVGEPTEVPKSDGSEPVEIPTPTP